MKTEAELLQEYIDTYATTKTGTEPTFDEWLKVLHPYLYVIRHKDNLAVDVFTKQMKKKLTNARDKGWGGWEDHYRCSGVELAQMLINQIHKANDGCFVDIANFAMMLHMRGEHETVLIDALNSKEGSDNGR